MTRRASAIAFGVGVAHLAAFFVSAQIVRIVEPLGVDQGLFACFTRWVPRGWLPYRDLFDSKPPLFLYWYALAAIAPGANVARAIWVAEGVWLAATLLVAYAIAKRVWGRWDGLFAAALLFIGLWSPAWGGFWSRAQAEELLTLPMLGAAWLAWRADARERLAVACGLLTGVCGLFKIPSLAIAGAWAIAWAATLPPRDAIRRTLFLAAGAAVPWTLAFLWFAAHGALHEMNEGIFVYARHNAAFIAPPWGRVVSEFGTHTILDASLPLLAAAVGVARLVERRARETWWIAPWVALTMGAIVAQRQLAGYHYLLMMPALAIAGGHGVAELARFALRERGGARALAAVGLAAILALAARSGATWTRAYGPDLAHVRGIVSRDAYLRQIQQGNYSVATEEQAAAYLRDHTSKDEGILVWGLSPGIYAIADRHPVTRFPFHKLLMTDAPLSRTIPGKDARRAELIDKMRADPPAYVLVGRGDANGFEPEESFSSMMRFPELREILKRDYHQETQIGRFFVLRRGAPIKEP